MRSYGNAWRTPNLRGRLNFDCFQVLFGDSKKFSVFNPRYFLLKFKRKSDWIFKLLLNCLLTLGRTGVGGMGRGSVGFCLSFFSWRIYYLCVIFHVKHKKIAISRCFNLISSGIEYGGTGTLLYFVLKLGFCWVSILVTGFGRFDRSFSLINWQKLYIYI